jgi:serine/threonine protein kinase
LTLPSGSHLGPCEILEPIGAGGTGEVYRARDPRLEPDVAIKVLSPEAPSDTSRLKRFEREARAAALLTHPSIVSIYETAQTEKATGGWRKKRDGSAPMSW